MYNPPPPSDRFVLLFIFIFKNKEEKVTHREEFPLGRDGGPDLKKVFDQSIGCGSKAFMECTEKRRKMGK